MKDCSTGHSAVVWVRKPNFESFCCSQPVCMPSLIVQCDPPEFFTFRYCALSFSLTSLQGIVVSLQEQCNWTPQTDSAHDRQTALLLRPPTADRRLNKYRWLWQQGGDPGDSLLLSENKIKFAYYHPKGHWQEQEQEQEQEQGRGRGRGRGRGQRQEE